MGVWSLICLYLGGRDIQILKKVCNHSISYQIWIYIFDMRLQCYRKREKRWGVSLAWLRLDGVLGCWVWFWLPRPSIEDIPALLRGHGLTEGGGLTRRHVFLWSYCTLEDNTMVVCRWAYNKIVQSLYANYQRLSVWISPSSMAAVRQLILAFDLPLGESKKNIPTRSNKESQWCCCSRMKRGTTKRTRHIRFMSSSSSVSMYKLIYILHKGRTVHL